MSEQMLIQNCSPTLAGLKTGNMFSFACDSTVEAFKWMRGMNKRLVPKGLRLLPLRMCKGRMLAYLYRPAYLERDIKNETAHRLLSANGYPDECDGCIIHLMERLRQSKEFPHEIGLFLGYPPDDVCGFINHKAACAKCVGCWKVYGDEQQARRRFAQFDKCTRIYNGLWQQGTSLEKLAIRS